MSELSLVRRAGAALKVGAAIMKGQPLEFGDSGIIGSLMPTDFGDPPKRGTKELLEAYSTMPWLRAVTSKVAVAVGSTQWRLYGTKRSGQRFHRDYKAQRTGDWQERRKHLIRLKQAGELVEVEDHPALDLLHNANPYHVGVAARRVLQVYLDLTGEFFQLLERNAMGVPVAYWPLPSTWVLRIPTPSNPVFRVKLGSEEFDIPSTEIIWAADLDPSNPYGRGSALAGTLGDELEASEYASKHVKSTFFNRARPDFVAWVKPRSGEDAVSVAEMRRLQQRWLQQHQGFFRAMKPHFVNRELEIHEFDQDFRKQSVIPIMEYERDTIIQVFGFPPEVFGILESSNRATIDAADYLFAKYATDPRLEFLREVWQERLIPYYDDRLILDYDSPVEKDKEHILNVAKAAPWAFTGDEWREMAEYEELDDDGGKVFGVPANVILEESLTDAAAMDEDSVAPDDKQWEESREKLAKAADPTHDYIQRLASRLEPKLRNAFVDAVSRMRSATKRSMLERLLAAGKDPEAVVDALPWDKLQASLGPKASATLRQSLASSMDFCSARLASRLGVDVGYTIEDPAAVKWLSKHLKDFMKGVENVNREAMANFLTQAYKDGMSPAEMARKMENHIGLTERQVRGVERFEDRLRGQGVKPDQIERRVERFSRAHVRKRAKTIARTETIRSANQGQQLVWEEAAKDGHVNAKKLRRRWMVTPDDRLDEVICEPMEGQTVKLDEPFKTGTGDEVLSPPAHPNCRCTVAMEI
jgi:hypothetical protein